jgi:hypothetical protein
MHGATVMEEMQACGVLYRIVEFEESDSETVHLLVFLLMQFMSRADQVYSNQSACNVFDNMQEYSKCISKQIRQDQQFIKSNFLKNILKNVLLLLYKKQKNTFF